MREFETRPPADLGDSATQVRQINRIQEQVQQAVLRIQADQRKLQQRVQAQTSWGTRGAGRNLSGPNANSGWRRSLEPGAYDRARKRLARAIQVDADELSNYFVLAQALFATQHRHAARMIEYGLRLDPDWLQAGHAPQRLYKYAGELLAQLVPAERADAGGASPRRGPGRRRFAFADVTRALRADPLVTTRSPSDSCSSQE
jgi:tetratricopeptide (TPR) repeat protein